MDAINVRNPFVLFTRARFLQERLHRPLRDEGPYGLPAQVLQGRCCSLPQPKDAQGRRWLRHLGRGGRWRLSPRAAVGVRRCQRSVLSSLCVLRRQIDRATMHDFMVSVVKLYIPLARWPSSARWSANRMIVYPTLEQVDQQLAFREL